MADIDPFEGAPSLPKIVAVSLQQTGHLYNFLAGDRILRRGERVLVESEAGARVGTVEIEPHEPATENLQKAIESATKLKVDLVETTRAQMNSNETFMVVGTKPF